MATHLPIPDDWAYSRRKLWLGICGIAFFLAFSIFWTFQAATAAREGRLLYVLFYFPAALTCASACTEIAIVLRLRFGDRSDKATWDASTGRVILQVPYALNLANLTASIAGTLACTTFSVGLWTDTLSFPMTPGQELMFPYFIAGVGLCFFVRGILRIVGQFQLPQIECTPTSLTVRGIVATRTIRWDDIGEIEAFSRREYQRNAAIAITPTDGAHTDVTVHYRGPFASAASGVGGNTITVYADMFSVGAVPLYWFLRFYLDNPEVRAELGDERASERLVGHTVDG